MNPDDDFGELDEFELFRARALGVESELLQSGRARKQQQQQQQQQLPSNRSRGRRTDNGSSGGGEKVSSRHSDKAPGRRRERNFASAGDTADVQNGDEVPPRGNESMDEPRTTRSTMRPISDGPQFDQRPEDEDGGTAAPRPRRTKPSAAVHWTGPTDEDDDDGGGKTARGSGDRSTRGVRHRSDSVEDDRLNPDTTATTAAANAAAENNTSGLDERHRVYRMRSFYTKSGNIVNKGDRMKFYGAGGGGGGSARPDGSASPRSVHSSGGRSTARTNSASANDRRSYRSSSGGGIEETSPDEDASSSRRRAGGCHESARTSSFEESLDSGGCRFRRETEPSAGEMAAAGTTTEDVEMSLICGSVLGGARSSSNRVPGRGGKGPQQNEGEEKTVYKVLVFGSPGVGKTTLTQQLLTSEYLANMESYAGKAACPSSFAINIYILF